MRARPAAKLAGCLIAAAAAVACSGGGGAPGGDRADSRVRVVRSGFQVLSEQLGAAAILRAGEGGGVRDVELRVQFYAGERLLGAERDTLPYCPPRTDCPWGQTLFGQALSPDWRSVDRVEVSVADAGGTLPDGARVDHLALSADDEAVRITPSGVAGTVYVIAFDGDVPRTGVSFFTTRGQRDELRYSQTLFARRPADAVRAYLYPGPVPERVGGPVD